MRRLVVLSALVITMAACNADQDPALDVPAATSTTTSTPGPTVPGETTTSAAAGEATGDPATPVSVPVAGPSTLVAVRSAKQGTKDRVTFEFSDSVPGYAIRYVEKPINEDASGKEVSIAGKAVIEVHMEAASGPSFTPAKSRIKPDTQFVTELVRTGDFEAVLTWAIGVRDRYPFTVKRLSDKIFYLEIGP